MEFEMQEKEYTLGEFYKLHKNDLPTIIMVTQGFSGDRLEETFDKGQVIRINSVLRQRRVIAVRLSERGIEECTYSFPVDYPIPFCLEDEMLYPNESLTLAEILNKRDLPVDVKFARKQIIQIGDNTSSTSLLFKLRLTNVFDEVYLLGNFIFDGDLDLQIVQIPLYLSAMKISKVVGLNVKSNSDWESFLRKLDGKAYRLNFDAFFGNREIARYKPNSLSTLVCSEREDNAFIYENLYPQEYTNIGELVEVGSPSQSKAANSVDDGLYEPLVASSVGKTTVKTSGKEKSTHNTNQSMTECSNNVDMYEPLVMAPAGNTKCKTADKKPKNKKSTHNTDQSKSPSFQQKLVCELTDRIQKGLVSPKYANSSDKPPIISPKPKFDRRASEPLLIGQKSAEVVPSEIETYENMKTNRASTSPKMLMTLSEECTVKGEPSNHRRIEKRDDTEIVNVGKLKVGELGRWMADKLHLGRYVARFAEELVDGAILVDLNENLLKEEFGFSPMEAKRLMKFAKEGHVPQ